MTTFLEDESSVEGSNPREAYEIILPSVTYRLASGVKDLTINGNTFAASPIRRGAVGVSNSNGAEDFSFTLPVSHALPQRYLNQGVPPSSILVKVLRHQQESGETEIIWTGYVTSLSCEGNTASFLVPSRSAQAFHRRLPTITAGRGCSHMLYDTQCQVARASFVVSTTVTFVAGRLIRVATMNSKPDYWAQFGELLHVASGERMTIADHIATDITMQLPIVDLAVGDAVEVVAGCAHDMSTCLDKFDNVANYGGLPYLPTGNVFRIGGLGIYTTE